MSKESIIPYSIPLEILAAFPPKAPQALVKFYQVIHVSGRFLWVGILQRIDELERQRLDFCLLEKRYEDTDDLKTKGPSLSPTFEELAKALRPNFRANLYFFDEEKHTPDAVRDSLRAYCEKEEGAKILWEQMLIKP